MADMNLLNDFLNDFLPVQTLFSTAKEQTSLAIDSAHTLVRSLTVSRFETGFHGGSVSVNRLTHKPEC